MGMLMGLSTSHNGWNGSYSSFGEWRAHLCRAAGLGDIEQYVGFEGAREWPEGDPLVKLLNHSDCEGDIAPDDCSAIADRLEKLLPIANAEGEFFSSTSDWWIEALRRAAGAGEPLEFY